MTFLTDQQTLEDLSIFGRRGGDSMFAIFNRTMTRQGSAVLEDMLRHPLADGAAIAQRSAIFQSFQVRETATRETATRETAARETAFPDRKSVV